MLIICELSVNKLAWDIVDGAKDILEKVTHISTL
jgi:hypothetical protein